MFKLVEQSFLLIEISRILHNFQVVIRVTKSSKFNRLISEKETTE